MYRSLNAIMKRAVTFGLAAMTFAPIAGAQRTTTAAAKPAASAPKAKERTNKWVFGAHTIAAPGLVIGCGG